MDPFNLTLRLMRGGFHRFYFGKSHFLKHPITHIPREVIILTWQCHPQHVPSFPLLPGQPILAWVQVVSKQLDHDSDFPCFHVWTFTQPCCVLFRFCCVECSSEPRGKAPGQSTLVSILCQNSPPPPPPSADMTKLQTGIHSRAWWLFIKPYLVHQGKPAYKDKLHVWEIFWCPSQNWWENPLCLGKTSCKKTFSYEHCNNLCAMLQTPIAMNDEDDDDDDCDADDDNGGTF